MLVALLVDLSKGAKKFPMKGFLSCILEVDLMSSQFVPWKPISLYQQPNRPRARWPLKRPLAGRRVVQFSVPVCAQF